MIEKDYSYNRFGSKGVRVGQAVHDIISKNQPSYTAEEILEEMGKGIIAYIQEAADKGYKEYIGRFFILHLFKKELSAMGVENAMLQKCTCFNDREWKPKEVMEMHPNSAKSLYEVNPKNGTILLKWTVPGWEDCKSILKNPRHYDSDLVGWVKDATRSFEVGKTG